MKEQFKEEVLKLKADHPEYSTRFLAYVWYAGKDAMRGNVMQRKANFIKFVEDRKQDLIKYLLFNTGFLTSTVNRLASSEEYLTDFILSGEWLEMD